MSQNFSYKNNRLFCENVDLNQLALEHKTPFYTYSKNEIISNCRQINSAGEGLDFFPCFAFKANYNPYLLTLIRDLGFGADVVSGGELSFALRLGFEPQKIVFAGVGKTAAEIELAIKSNIHSLNIESAEELQLTATIASRLKKKTRIALRVNPDIEANTHEYISTGKHINKFGISVQEATELFSRANDDEWLEPQGIHVHIGSQITTKQPYLDTIDFLLNYSAQLIKMGSPISFLDLGGGIGVDYYDSFQETDKAENYIKEILPLYLNGFKDSGFKLVVELGRAVIASSGILVSKVLYRKQTPLKKFIIIDAAMNNLIRPSLYKAYHEIVPLTLTEEMKEIVDIVGPVCESTDFLAKDRDIQTLHQGDFMAITGAGAYGQALASNYNLRPTAAEYLIDEDKVSTIFKGRSVDSIFSEFEV